MKLEETGKFRETVLENLEDVFNASGMITRMEQEEDISILRVFLDELGAKKSPGDGTGLLELCFLPYENEEQPGESLIQIYSTFVKELDPAKIPALLELLNAHNQTCVLGAFGIYAQGAQVYHKYILISQEEDVARLEEVIRQAVNWVLQIITESYDAILELAKGE